MSTIMQNMKIQQPRPPEKGIFPLDHLGECTDLVKVYMDCLKENSKNSLKCREASQKYLQCRMDNGLMLKQSMDELGFKDLKQSKRQK